MKSDRLDAYKRCRDHVLALCGDEPDEVARMASLVGVLHHEMPGFFWTGFYRVVEGGLVIGPYQGTVGCLRIAPGKGVCGTALATGETQVVPNVHKFPGHITCDSRSQSEIVVPVKDPSGKLIAVLDIDSTELNHFDQIDREQLEELLAIVFG